MIQSLKDNARIVAVTFEMTLRQTATDAFIIFAVLIQPLIIALLALWMLKDKPGNYGIFVVVGSAMTGLWSSLLFISGNSITVERWSGTLETIVGMPTHLSVIVFGKNLANVVQSLVSMVASYAIAALLFGYDLRIDQPVLFAGSLVFTIISFVCFGLLIAPVFIINPAVQSFQNALEFPVYILAGFLFPIALLPNWTTPVSYLLAPYWAARALHATSSGGGTVGEVVLYWGAMLLLGVIYLTISRILFRVMLRKARADATLGME
ncbi:MAG: ABC transporter permease [Anaerolineae bacterium]|nr:ABC transporter permease [Anaerolineae bacterium]